MRAMRHFTTVIDDVYFKQPVDRNCVLMALQENTARMIFTADCKRHKQCSYG